MPENEDFGFKILIGGVPVPEYSKDGMYFVECNLMTPHSYRKPQAEIVQGEVESQNWPVTPYQILVYAKTASPTFYYRVLVDGVKVKGLSLQPGSERLIRGFADGPAIREFLFSMPRFAKDETDRLSGNRTEEVGKIIVQCWNAKLRKTIRTIRMKECKFDQANKKDSTNVTQGAYTMATSCVGAPVSSRHLLRHLDTWKLESMRNSLTIAYHMPHTLTEMGFTLKATDFKAPHWLHPSHRMSSVNRARKKSRSHRRFSHEHSPVARKQGRLNKSDSEAQIGKHHGSDGDEKGNMVEAKYSIQIQRRKSAETTCTAVNVEEIPLSSGIVGDGGCEVQEIETTECVEENVLNTTEQCIETVILTDENTVECSADLQSDLLSSCAKDRNKEHSGTGPSTETTEKETSNLTVIGQSSPNKSSDDIFQNNTIDYSTKGPDLHMFEGQLSTAEAPIVCREDQTLGLLEHLNPLEMLADISNTVARKETVSIPITGHDLSPNKAASNAICSEKVDSEIEEINCGQVKDVKEPELVDLTLEESDDEATVTKDMSRSVMNETVKIEETGTT